MNIIFVIFALQALENVKIIYVLKFVLLLNVFKMILISLQN